MADVSKIPLIDWARGWLIMQVADELDEPLFIVMSKSWHTTNRAPFPPALSQPSFAGGSSD